MKDLCFPGTFPPVLLSHFTAVMSALLTVFITTGNALIIAAIAKDPRKQLRNPFAYFLANLAISDFIVGVIAMPVSIIFHVMEAKRSIDSTSVYIVHITFFLSLAASLFSMAAMCFDRYYTVLSLSNGQRRFNRYRCAKISMAIWLLSIAYTCLYIFTGYITLTTIYLNVSFVSIFGITLLTYVKTMRRMKAISATLNKHSRKTTVADGATSQTRRGQNMGTGTKEQSDRNTRHIRTRTNRESKVRKVLTASKQDNGDINVTENGEERNNKISRIQRSGYKQKRKLAIEQRITRVFLAMLATFLSSHLPATVFNFVLQFCLSCSCNVRHIFRDIVFILLPTASGLNALICILKLPNIRIAVQEILTFKKKTLYTFHSTDVGENSKSRSPRQWYTPRGSMILRFNLAKGDVTKQTECGNGKVVRQYSTSCASSQKYELDKDVKKPSFTVDEIQNHKNPAPVTMQDSEEDRASKRMRSLSFPGSIRTPAAKGRTNSACYL